MARASRIYTEDYETTPLLLNVVLKLSCLTNLSCNASLACVCFEWHAWNSYHALKVANFSPSSIQISKLRRKVGTSLYLSSVSICLCGVWQSRLTSRAC